jgi:alpha-glucosidase
MKKFFALFTVLFILLTVPLCQQASVRPGTSGKMGKLISYDYKNGKLVLNYDNLSAVVEILDGPVVKVSAAYRPALPYHYSYAVVSEKPLGGADKILFLSNQLYIIRWNNYEVRVPQDGMFGVSLLQNGKQIFKTSLVEDDEEEKLYLVSPAEKERYFGLGEKTGKLELTGRKFENYNSDTYKYGFTTDPVYCSIPFYLAIGSGYSYGVFIDNPARSEFSFKKDDYSQAVYDDRIDFYIIPGDPKTVIKNYSSLTGFANLPPMWGLGFHQCRYSYESQKEVLGVAEKFLKNGLPIDSIYLDIGFMSNNMAFTYNPAAFPDPKGMDIALEKQGIRLVAIVDPGIKTDKKYGVYTSGTNLGVYVMITNKSKSAASPWKIYTGSVWPGLCAFPDFTKPATFKWWQSHHPVLVNLGIDGFWNDMNEPSVFNVPGGTMAGDAVQDNNGTPTEHMYLHNIYGLTMISATFAAMRAIQPDKRVFILTRSGYAGVQRFAFVWTGDNSADWTHLAMNVSMVLNLGLSGVPFSGADIGGYTGSPAEELFVRWIQLGAFIPFMRDHSEKGTKYQEPYVFEKSLPIIKKYMKLRYTLMPYLYTMAYEASRDGIPVARPLFLEFGGEYLDIDQEFLFGDSILVAPVLDPLKKKDSVSVILPTGIWYDYFSGKVSKAGNYSLPVTMEDIPVYVRGGSIIPVFAFDYMSTMELQKKRDVTLTIYPDESGSASGRLFEDDMVSYAYQKGAYVYTKFEYKSSGNSASITSVKEGGFALKRKLTVVLPKGITALTYNGKAVAVTDGKAVLE